MNLYVTRVNSDIYIELNTHFWNISYKQRNHKMKFAKATQFTGGGEMVYFRVSMVLSYDLEGSV